MTNKSEQLGSHERVKRVKRDVISLARLLVAEGWLEPGDVYLLEFNRFVEQLNQLDGFTSPQLGINWPNENATNHDR